MVYSSYLIQLVTIDCRIWRRHETISNANSLEVDNNAGSWIFLVNLTSNCGYPFACQKTCQFQEFGLILISATHTSIRFSKNIKVIGLIFRIECEELCQEAVEVLKENEMHPMVMALYICINN